MIFPQNKRTHFRA